MPKKELSALASVKAFNDMVRRAAAKGSEMLSCIWKAGEIAKKAKKSTPHGEWMTFVANHYDVNHNTVTRWIRFHETVRESELARVQNLTAGIKMLDPPKSSELCTVHNLPPSGDDEQPEDEPDEEIEDGEWEAEEEEEVQIVPDTTSDEGPDPKKVKKLAHSYRDKLARAICDYHELKPNRSQRDRLVKQVQEIQLW